MAKLTRIHVNRQRIASNLRHGTHLPAIGIERSGVPKRYASAVLIGGPSLVIYRPDKPLRCGAKAWIETHSRVTVVRL